MTLPAGTRLGSHEIIAAIGAGGMGEVYRARDTKLARDVTLKVLPAEMASSPERLERFQREPELSLALVRRGLGAMATDVDRRMAAAWGQAGLE